MLHYAFQIVLFQVIFLCFYDLLLKRETFFNWNRAYLLITPLISCILPFIKIDFLSTDISSKYVSTLTQIITPDSDISNSKVSIDLIQNFDYDQINWFIIVYCIGMFISLFLLILKIHRLYIINDISIKSIISKTKVITLYNSNQAFSFWNSIFLGDSLTDKEQEQIIAHEIVHIKHKHSLDNLLYECLKIVLWWNPFIYIYQTRVVELHEYIADSIAIHSIEKKSYLQQLLNTSFQTESISFVNHFFNESLIKKRVLMLQKARSVSNTKYKFLVLMPLFLGILTYTSCNTDIDTKTLHVKNTMNKNIDYSVLNEPYCLNQDSQYDKKLHNYLKLTIGEKASIIVKLFNLATSDTIRTAYVPSNNTYKVKNIPPGEYQLKIIYGTDYIETSESGDCIAQFNTVHFTEIDTAILDFTPTQTATGMNVPSYTLSLDVLPEALKQVK